jgi:hypothetical protein
MPTMFKSKKLFTLGFLTTFIFVFSMSCHHETIIPSTPSISFKNEVEPIITGSCALSGCHGNDFERFRLTNYDEIRKQVTPGNATSSRLYKSITKLGPGQMPPDRPLSEDQLRLIYVWIMQGAKNN